MAQMARSVPHHAVAVIVEQRVLQIVNAGRKNTASQPAGDGRAPPFSLAARRPCRPSVLIFGSSRAELCITKLWRSPVPEAQLWKGHSGPASHYSLWLLAPAFQARKVDPLPQPPTRRCGPPKRGGLRMGGLRAGSAARNSAGRPAPLPQLGHQVQQRPNQRWRLNLSPTCRLPWLPIPELNSIIALPGRPAMIVSNNGTQLTSWPVLDLSQEIPTVRHSIFS
jgi:hypothetical protein